MKKLRLIGGLIGSAMLVGSGAVVDAKEPALTSSRILQALSSVPNPELPAKAASLVLIDQSDQRETTAEGIVGIAVELNPVAAPMIVSAIAKLSPDVAPAVAAAAGIKQPKQIDAIAKAAAAAAPGQALKIVAAMCKGQPGEYQKVALAVAEAVPGMDRSIINSVTESVPTLKPFFVRAAEALAKEPGVGPSVSMFLQHIFMDVEQSGAKLKTPVQTIVTQGLTANQIPLLPTLAELKPPPEKKTTPIVRPAFAGLFGAPNTIDRDQTTVIKPGSGRDYSQPQPDQPPKKDPPTKEDPPTKKE